MTTLTSSQIKEHLHQNVCTVVFEKADGTTRKMNCTLNQNVIEMHNLTPVGSGPVYDENQIRVVDVGIMNGGHLSMTR